MNENLEEIEFTIFDTETTGLDPRSGDRIVEIAAIRIKGEEKIAEFQSLVNPQKAISEGAFRVNGITQEDLNGAPKPEEVFPRFMEFITGSCLCSYNAPFDLEFLENELKLLGKDLSGDIAVLDVLTMARKLLPGLERYALSFVSKKLGIETLQKHRAFSDVEITREVFKKLGVRLHNKGVTNFNGFLTLFGVGPHFLDNVINQKITRIQEAIDLGAKLKIKYFSTSGADVSEREVIPKEIRKDRSRSYLVGYCCLKEEERTFRIDGILHLEIV
ncbi:MAG: exonuclease domain-containing protein [Candidatus Omnitrophica bacterium]|nr:exonuclease domain-containing protein [Candidatus Omnitrophota bacterium]